MHTGWETNRSRRLWCRRKTGIELPPQQRGGMTLTTGGLQWVAINPSEGTGMEGEAGGTLCVRECFDDGDDRAEYSPSPEGQQRSRH